MNEKFNKVLWQNLSGQRFKNITRVLSRRGGVTSELWSEAASRWFKTLLLILLTLLGRHNNSSLLIAFAASLAASLDTGIPRFDTDARVCVQRGARVGISSFRLSAPSRMATCLNPKVWLNWRNIDCIDVFVRQMKIFFHFRENIFLLNCHQWTCWVSSEKLQSVDLTGCDECKLV